MRLWRLALLGEYCTLANRSVLGPESWVVLRSHPLPHDCIITPRFPDVASILAEERNQLQSAAITYT